MAPTVSELLDRVIGQRLEAVTMVDHDARDQASPHAEVVLRFSGGQTLHFWINEVEGRIDDQGDAIAIEVEVERQPRRQIEE